MQTGENQEKILEAGEKLHALKNETKKRIVGQERLVESVIVAIFAGGHVILEGVPGLAKTLTVETLSETLDLGYSRIQFTPDLLPSDLTGGQIYNQSESKFYTKKGPIFTNFLLADEINRAPAKVQSALLEAMQEQQVTIGEETFALPSPFIVLATENPIEQEGTYPLPEAQLDRFLLKTIVDYPSKVDEIEIMKRSTGMELEPIKKILKQKEILNIRSEIENSVYVDGKIFEYVRDIVFATRNPSDYGIEKLDRLIEYGASPRASIALIKTAKVSACLRGRSYVIPEDVKYMAKEVLRHRIGLSFEALGDDISSDEIVTTILDNVIVP